MTDHPSQFDLSSLGLGKPTNYQSEYSPDLLQAVPRALNRNELMLPRPLPFHGVDVWHGYELSWLNSRGKPIVRLMRCSIPCSSPNLVESKSFKLYLNSFNQSRFATDAEVISTLTHDLSKIAGESVTVELYQPDDLNAFRQTALPGTCLDSLDIDVDGYQFDRTVLEQNASDSSATTSETLHSHLLKSNCLITNQPDWASVIVEYEGQAIGHEALLRYLISFRTHNEFHEQCVERIYTDLMRIYQLTSLSVQALYTRRGGLDINPFRTSEPDRSSPFRRINRQ